MASYFEKDFTRDLLLLSVIIAAAGMTGSLYFSDILGFAPCVLCWYQRIALYPLVPILGVGYYRHDRMVGWYALPLVVVGLLISIYHNLLYWNILPESVAPCVQGISCTTRYISWFGFVTIPFLALLAFAALLVLIVWYTRRTRSAT